MKCCRAGAVELRNTIAEHFHVDLPATLTFDHPTLGAIAAYLTETMVGNSEEKTFPNNATMATCGDISLNIELGEKEGKQYTAIVGISARFPGEVTNLSDFWLAARNGRNLQQEVPFDRWDLEKGYHPSIPPRDMTIYVRFGSFCTGMHDDYSSC